MVNIIQICLDAQKVSIEEKRREDYHNYITRKIKRENEWWKQFHKHMGNLGMPKYDDSKKSYMDRFMSFEFKKEKI